MVLPIRLRHFTAILDIPVGQRRHTVSQILCPLALKDTYAKLVFPNKNVKLNLWFLIQISPSQFKGSAYAINNLYAITLTVLIASKNKILFNFNFECREL